MSGPGRQQNLFLLQNALNGTPTFLGRIVTAGAAVNNSTTATPFAATPRGAGVAGIGINYETTLAGRCLLIQPVTDAILFLPAATAGDLTVTLAAGLKPGVRLGVGERATLFMPQDMGWLQMLSEAAGAATLLVWELT